MTAKLVNRLKVRDSPAMKEYSAVEFDVEDPSGSFSMLQVNCPSCKREFWVTLDWRSAFAVNGKKYATRSCPYCFRTHLVPDFNRSRTVKRRKSKKG